MKVAEVISLWSAQVEDYSRIDSTTLLKEGTKTHELCYLTWAVLLVQASLLVKEVTANGVSEKAKHIEAEARETLDRYRILRRELTLIEAEMVRRIWRNGTNGNFAKFKLGVLRNDWKAQEEALQELQKILGSIPWKKGWFHPEGHHGIDSMTNLLLAKELDRHQHLELQTTVALARRFLSFSSSSRITDSSDARSPS